MSSFISGNLIHFIFSNWILYCKLTECLFISSIFKLKNVHGKDCSEELFERPAIPKRAQWVQSDYCHHLSFMFILYALDMIVFKCSSYLKYVPQYFLQIYFRLCNKIKYSCPMEWTLVHWALSGRAFLLPRRMRYQQPCILPWNATVVIIHEKYFL